MARKAIILAAGLGTRLRPLDAATPKPLMPVWGESMLSRVAAMLRGWGVEEIAVNCHHLREKIEEWCARNRCVASSEPEILGTGGALNPLREWLGGEPFYLVNGDIVAEGIDALPEAFSGDFASDEIARCIVCEEGPRTIEVEPYSRFVTCWKSLDAGLPGTYTYCGIALLSPAIFGYVEPSGYSTIIQAYERAAADGRFVRAVSPEGLLWTDAGTVDSYIEVNTSGEDNAYGSFPQLQAAGGEGKIEFLGARGSDRCFFRRGNRVVIAYDDAARPENARYAGHARWLKAAGASVPDVLADVPSEKTLALEWAGEAHEMSFDEYVQAVKALAGLHLLAGRDDLPELEEPFGPGLWKWERDLFEKHCLGGRYGLEMTEAVEKELSAAADALDSEPKALVHRDFQSSNILWRGGRLAMIDFQGMRLGPGSYDLASLLYDPYAKISPKMRMALAALYAKETGRTEAAANLHVAAVRRLVQALGAFGRLASAGKTEFLKYTEPALENLLSVADEAGFDALGALAEDLIARERHFKTEARP